MTRLALTLTLALAAEASAAGGEPPVLELAPQVRVPARFQLKDEVEVRGERIPLADLAQCAGAPAVCEEAYAVDVGLSPPPGKQVLLGKDKILATLASEWPESAIELEGPANVKIRAAYEELDEGRVAARLQESLRGAEAGGLGFRVLVEKLTVGAEKLRPGLCQVEFPLLHDLASRSADWVVRHLSGHQRLEAECVYDEATVRPHAFTASAQLVLERHLPVAKKDLRRGDEVRPDDFETAWVAVGREHAGAVESVAAARGRRLTRAVSVGRPVLWTHLELLPIVQRGQLVRLEMRRGGLDVSGQVKALAGGARGQVIDAVYPGTKKKLRVRVKDGETVEYAHD